jgi:PAS domain S-box-containing protein
MQRTAEEVIGRTWAEIGSSDDEISRFQTMMNEVFSSGAPTIVETSLRTPDGTRHVERNFSPLHDKDGQVVAVVITDHDITDRKYVEEVLRENQRLFTSIFDTALAGIAVLNADGRYIQVNRAFCDIYGYHASELIGRPFSLVFRPADQARERKMHERLISGDIYDPRSEWTAIHKDGREIEITAYSNLLVREDGQRFRVVAVVDVTAQKQAQRALEASEQRLTSILNSMEDAVWSVTAAGHQLFYANPAIETVTGYSAEDFTANQQLLVDIVHPDDRERFAAQLDHAPDAARMDTEYRIVRRDGEERWIHNRFWLVTGANGQQRIDGIMIDTTDRRHAAERAMQLVFERERVRILSDFVRDASHEFRTPLSVINTRLYLMEKISDPQRQSEFIEGIREQADRILRLVESLITMSRLDSLTQLHAERADLNHLLRRVQSQLRTTAQHKNLEISLNPTPEPLPVQADAEQLMTALNAVLDNAVSFTLPGGHIDLRTQRLESGEAALEVRDTGIGMSETELPHIFKRFYRVDAARTARGFGLGLPIALKIVELHRGRIEVESEPGKGSSFRVILPLAKR